LNWEKVYRFFLNNFRSKKNKKMNWINNVVRPKIKGILSKRDTPNNLWIKCPETGQMVFHSDLEENQWVMPGSEYHMKIPAKKRLEFFYDNGNFELIETKEIKLDPLKFKDEKRYIDRLKDARKKTGMDDAVIIAKGLLNDRPTISIVQDFAFMGGSLGMAAGEAIINAMSTAVKNKIPVVLFSAAGGARMQEGILSLMQMPRTTVAVQQLNEAGLPYVVVLTNPTTGGVTASYAMLGDVHIAEPGALIGFAGPRVIEQTIKEKLPEGFQRAEYLLEHGMIDMVVHRHELRDKLITIFSHLNLQKQ
jgi:acetyl-CoA carboxylase carboxyl transferase subunit beta|tara:strand:+ start:8934 stop:9851 length:918 start_codon:yes stop_codon:yes gene_type:complete